MAELTVRFDLSFGARTMRCLMASAMIVSAVTEVASESVTLTTYYPAPSGVYSQMITTGNTFLARDGGYLDVGTTGALAAGTKMAVMGGSVGIGTTSPGYTLDVAGTFHVSGPAWAALIQSGSASAYFAHSGGYGSYIDAGTSANSGTYALDVNKGGVPYLFVRGDGYTGFGTATPGIYTGSASGPHNPVVDVAGAEGDYGYLPHYSNWATYGTGDGGAAIYNDSNAAGYQTLMIVGNNSAGHERRVSVWDRLFVNGPVITTDSSCTETPYDVDGTTPCPGGQYATFTAGIISYMSEGPLYSVGVTGGKAPMLCCLCQSGICPL
jgi:hypothetical protein